MENWKLEKKGGRALNEDRETESEKVIEMSLLMISKYIINRKVTGKNNLHINVIDNVDVVKAAINCKSQIFCTI